MSTQTRNSKGNLTSDSHSQADHLKVYHIQPVVTDTPLSPRTAKWIKELTPVLEPYNFDVSEISDLIHRCHYDANQIELAVSNVIEDFSGRESGQWTKVGKNRSVNSNNFPKKPKGPSSNTLTRNEKISPNKGNKHHKSKSGISVSHSAHVDEKNPQVLNNEIHKKIQQTSQSSLQKSPNKQSGSIQSTEKIATTLTPTHSNTSWAQLACRNNKYATSNKESLVLNTVDETCVSLKDIVSTKVVKESPESSRSKETTNTATTAGTTTKIMMNNQYPTEPSKGKAIVEHSGIELGIKVGSRNSVSAGIQIGSMESLSPQNYNLGVYLPEGRTVDPNASEGLLFGSFGAVDISKQPVEEQPVPGVPESPVISNPSAPLLDSWTYNSSKVMTNTQSDSNNTQNNRNSIPSNVKSNPNYITQVPINNQQQSGTNVATIFNGITAPPGLNNASTGNSLANSNLMVSSNASTGNITNSTYNSSMGASVAPQPSNGTSNASNNSNMAIAAAAAAAAAAATPYNYAYLNYASYATNFPYMVGGTATFSFPPYGSKPTAHPPMFSQYTQPNPNHQHHPAGIYGISPSYDSSSSNNLAPSATTTGLISEGSTYHHHISTQTSVPGGSTLVSSNSNSYNNIPPIASPGMTQPIAVATQNNNSMPQAMSLPINFATNSNDFAVDQPIPHGVFLGQNQRSDHVGNILPSHPSDFTHPGYSPLQMNHFQAAATYGGKSMANTSSTIISQSVPTPPIDLNTSTVGTNGSTPGNSNGAMFLSNRATNNPNNPVVVGNNQTQSAAANGTPQQTGKPVNFSSFHSNRTNNPSFLPHHNPVWNNS
ncbi:hypothetical protein cand_037590 [Cryptosporidium andersoni]|uniref:Uncharacterized protein n=1 Tax=Cryptosporidium andersoni TaxID=117008 RepID=A0A1J4MV59_9CRYT|nr:hypothetical protein cand_037590 [Cryptosporidium andersoni]